jgi:hypothetical protein
VAGDQFVSHGQRRDDVASGAASGDEYAQSVRQIAFYTVHLGFKPRFIGSKPSGNMVAES